MGILDYLLQGEEGSSEDRFTIEGLNARLDNLRLEMFREYSDIRVIQENIQNEITDIKRSLVGLYDLLIDLSVSITQNTKTLDALTKKINGLGNTVYTLQEVIEERFPEEMAKAKKRK